MSAPVLALKNGTRCPKALPAIAFGTAFGNWTDSDQPIGFCPEQANRAVTLALDAGYRCLDGARFYSSDRVIGRILGERFASGALKREDVWITTKVAHPKPDTDVFFNPAKGFDWKAEHTDAEVEQAIRDQLFAVVDDLCVGYVDLCLIHWPGPYPDLEAPKEKQEADAARAKRYRHVIYKTLLSLKAAGAIHAVGLSNCNVKHLAELKEAFPDDLPAVNQVEANPYCFDRELVEAYQAAGTVMQAYAPFASGCFGLMKDETLAAVGAAHGVGIGQVICRWLYQHGIGSIPKSSSAARMAQNLDIGSFEITKDEMAQIDALSAGKDQRRTCPDPSIYP